MDSISDPELTYRDHRDLVIETYRLDLENERTEHARARAELSWSREANRAAVELIRKLILQGERGREINRRLRIELKQLRDALLDQNSETRAA